MNKRAEEKETGEEEELLGYVKVIVKLKPHYIFFAASSADLGSWSLVGSFELAELGFAGLSRIRGSVARY